jgi:type IV pilus assembly protein PilW
MRVPRGEAGFSLAELVIAIVIVAIMGLGMVTMFQAQHHSFVQQNDGLRSTQNARAALDLMARDIRNAGFDPYGSAGAGVTAWTADSFAYTADLNGDGDLLDTDESVTYYVDTITDQLMRGSFGTNVRMADGVQGLAFTYYQNATGTAATSASNIEQVKIQMTYDTPEGVMDGSLETQVALRNNIY